MIGFVGSRRLPSGFAGLVRRVVLAFVRSGADIAVGCSDGADAVVIRSVVEAGAASRLSVFAVGDRLGNGFWRLSAFPAVCVARDAGARVFWRAGGVFGSLRVRLARRSEALVRAVAASPGRRGLVAFVSSPCPLDVAPSARFAGRGSGSWGAVALAVGLGLPVVVFPCGLGPSALPGWWGGHWVPVASSGLWARAFRFVPLASGSSGSPGRRSAARAARSVAVRAASGAAACAAAPALSWDPLGANPGLTITAVLLGIAFSALIWYLLTWEDRYLEQLEIKRHTNRRIFLRLYEEHLRAGGNRLSWLNDPEGSQMLRNLTWEYTQSPFFPGAHEGYRRLIEEMRETEIAVARSLGLEQTGHPGGTEWFCRRCGEVLREDEVNIFAHRC